MILDDIKKEIEKADKIAIVTHENPDGDAIGGSLSMYMALKNINKNVDVIIPEYARMFNFLPCINEAKKSSDEHYDLVISVDCATEKRLKDNNNCFSNAKVTIQIDHHEANKMFADYNYVDPVSPACCQILIKVLKYWKMDINKEMGICLLAGIITDTGGFKYSGVTSETFEIVAWLLDKGINISSVYRKVLQTISKTKFELNKIATSRITLYENDKIAFTYITMEDEKRVKAELGDYEGCVDIGRDIEDVEVSIFIRELEEGGYKISMRSNDYVNVSDICLMFGGGGHMKAAGCTISSGTIEQIRDKLIDQTKRYLK